MLNSRVIKTSAIALCLGFVSGQLTAISANTSNTTPKQGPAFTDPNYSEAMPASWIDKPIQYEKIPADTDLAITLDQHLYPALLPLIQNYAAENKLKIAVQEGTCGISAGALLDKKVDIGGFCCPPGKTDRLPGLSYHTLGIASLALLTHPDNPVDNISMAQAQEIYQGNMGDWRQLSNNTSGNIETVARLHCKTRPGHWRLILDNEDQFSATVKEVSTIPDMISATASSRQSIGYETLWMTEHNANRGQVKAIKINNISPNDNKALAEGKYPFYRTYNITTWSGKVEHRPEADKLLAYLYEHFNKIDAKYGFVSSADLRAAGWQFKGDELIGSPRS